MRGTRTGNDKTDSQLSDIFADRPTKTQTNRRTWRQRYSWGEERQTDRQTNRKKQTDTGRKPDKQKD